MDVRAMIDMIREDEQKVQMVAAMCVSILIHACDVLTILDPELGDEELIQAVASTLTKIKQP
jgi:hypothetical protein